LRCIKNKLLYIAPLAIAQSLDSLQMEGITHVVNLTGFKVEEPEPVEAEYNPLTPTLVPTLTPNPDPNVLRFEADTPAEGEEKPTIKWSDLEKKVKVINIPDQNTRT